MFFIDPPAIRLSSFCGFTAGKLTSKWDDTIQVVISGPSVPVSIVFEQG
jgi:hypothetical protein